MYDYMIYFVMYIYICCAILLLCVCTIYMIVLTYFLYILACISCVCAKIRIVELQFRYAVTPCVSVSLRILN